MNALLNIGDAVKSAIPIFDNKSGPILVTSANGVVAYRVALKLVHEAAEQSSLRVGVPDPSELQNLKDKGAEVVEFDWEKEETYAKALEGIKSVFIAMPHHSDWEKQFTTFLDTAKKAHVKNFVKLSFSHALASEGETMLNFATVTRKDDPLLKVPLVQMHRECDSKLVHLPVSYNYTILFASHFMSNPTVYQADKIRKENKFEGASGGHGVNYVSPNDVAEVAVQALLQPNKHHRKGYNCTGPAPILDSQIAVVLSTKLGTKIEYVDKPLESFKSTAEDTDWGPGLDVTLLEYAKASGAEEKAGFVSKDIERVCGHPAETYEQYLQNQDVMTPRELAYLGIKAANEQVVSA